MYLRGKCVCVRVCVCVCMSVCVCVNVCILPCCNMRLGFNLWFGKILWRREWLLTPVFLPGEFCGQRSLVNYSPWGCKESDMTELTLALLSLFICVCVFTDMYIYSFSILSPYRSLQNVEYSSLCYTVDSCWLPWWLRG